MSRHPHTKRFHRGLRRALWFEPLEARNLLANSFFGPLMAAASAANPWHNPVLAPDVNGQDDVTPLDVLLVVQQLNVAGSGPVPAEASGPPYYDVSGDGQVTPGDALLVIRHINTRTTQSTTVAANTAQFLTATGTGRMTIDTSDNPQTVLADVGGLLDTDPSLSLNNKPGGSVFRDGLVAFTVTQASVGATLQVSLTAPSGIPTGARVYTVNQGGFAEFTATAVDGPTVTLSITDGGPGDNDGVQDGNVVVVAGIATPWDLKKKWTVLVYADADNDLEKDLLDEFRLLSAVPDYSNFNILVQLDRAEATKQGYGNWESTHRFVMSHGLEPFEKNAVPDWEDGGGGGREVDMTDPASLRDFINWGATHFPAENLVLIVSDHGYGWRGLCVDNTSGSARMTIRDLSAALATASAKLDLIFFDACYMQSVEVAYELRNSGAKYIVGSQAPSTPVMPFDRIFAELGNHPHQSLLDLAKTINDRYAEKYQAGDYFTQSTVELAKIAAVVDAHTAFVQAIVSQAGFAAQQAQAAVLSARLAEAVVYNRTGGAAAGYTGLGIYFPEPLPLPPTPASPGELDFYIKWTIAFSTESGWKRFLDVYTSPGGQPPFPIDLRIVAARQALDGTVGDDLAVVDLGKFCDLVSHSK